MIEDAALVKLAQGRGEVLRDALVKLGLFWTILTMAFEFLFGHYVMGHSWDALWADYNVLQGRLWPLVLIVTLFGPLLAQKIRG